jgi:hypothetical protein
MRAERSWCCSGSGDAAPTGEPFDGPVLGLYEIQAGRLARAQMFSFDTVSLSDFLANAAT